MARKLRKTRSPVTPELLHFLAERYLLVNDKILHYKKLKDHDKLAALELERKHLEQLGKELQRGHVDILRGYLSQKIESMYWELQYVLRPHRIESAIRREYRNLIDFYASLPEAVISQHWYRFYHPMMG